jgi:dephospho-CoA kinase
MFRIGLTGGIACGKSHVLARFATRGFHTLDLDRVARDVVLPGSAALAEVAESFGPGVLATNGTLDRARLAAIVFDDAGARRRLDAIVHPRVRELERAWAAGLSQEPGSVAVTDAALLVEAGVHLRFDRLVVVHCAPELQIARLRSRDGLSETEARARIDAQMPVEEKAAFAHYRIDTSGELATTHLAADRLADRIRSEAGAVRAPASVPGERLLGALELGPRSGPRGLTSLGVLISAARLGGLDMGALGRSLEPPFDGPWYRAAGSAPPDAPAAALATAVAVWSILRRRGDELVLAAAAGSLARLTHDDAAARADAIVFALAACDAIMHGSLPQAGGARMTEIRKVARQWGGAGPSGALGRVWSAAAAHPDDAAEAAKACVALGGEAEGLLASALVGAVQGRRREEVDPAVAGALLALHAEG